MVARDEIGRNDCEWVENWIYPGTHWILYGKNRDYIGRIDKNPCYGDLYRWEAYPFREKQRVYGYAETLEDAMKAVNQVVFGQAFQLSLPLDYEQRCARFLRRAG